MTKRRRPHAAEQMDPRKRGGQRAPAVVALAIGQRDDLTWSGWCDSFLHDRFRESRLTVALFIPSIAPIGCFLLNLAMLSGTALGGTIPGFGRE